MEGLKHAAYVNLFIRKTGFVDGAESWYMSCWMASQNIQIWHRAAGSQRHVEDWTDNEQRINVYLKTGKIEPVSFEFLKSVIFNTAKHSSHKWLSISAMLPQYSELLMHKYCKRARMEQFAAADKIRLSHCITHWSEARGNISTPFQVTKYMLVLFIKHW